MDEIWIYIIVSIMAIMFCIGGIILYEIISSKIYDKDREEEEKEERIKEEKVKLEIANMGETTITNFLNIEKNTKEFIEIQIQKTNKAKLNELELFLKFFFKNVNLLIENVCIIKTLESKNFSISQDTFEISGDLFGYSSIENINIYYSKFWHGKIEYKVKEGGDKTIELFEHKQFASIFLKLKEFLMPTEDFQTNQEMIYEKCLNSKEINSKNEEKGEKKQISCKFCKSKNGFKLIQVPKSNLILIVCKECNNVLTDLLDFCLNDIDVQISFYKKLKSMIKNGDKRDFMMMCFYQLRLILKDKGFNIDEEKGVSIDALGFSFNGYEKPEEKYFHGKKDDGKNK